MTDFTLRPIAPTDGPAMDRLMRSEAQSTRLALSTQYHHDVYQALIAQHPTLFGVVAEAPGRLGLAGMATAFSDQVTIGDAELPCAHLENLKVHHGMRRQGLGGRLAAWRIEEAERRHGRDVVITAGVESSNAASLATAARWATHLLGPVRIVIAGPRSSSPRGRNVDVQPLEERHIEAVTTGSNAFYSEHVLYPKLTAERLAESLATTPLGWPIRQYRVALAPQGGVLAGARVGERYRLMVDRIERVPAPLAIVGRMTGMLPADRIIRTIEVSGVWHVPDRPDAAHQLWDAIRHEWRDRVTNVGAQVDPRSGLYELLRPRLTVAPRIEIMIPVRSPLPIDEQAPVYLWR